MKEGKPDAVAAAAQKALDRLENKKTVLPETRVWALEILAVARSMQGDSASSNRIFAQSYELLDRIGQQDSGVAGVVLNNWANNLAVTSPSEALALHQRVIAIFEGQDPESVPMPVRLNYGFELNRLARFREARAAHESVRAAALKHDNTRMLGLSDIGLAAACRGLGDLACARAALREAGPALRPFPPGQRVFADLARERGLLAAAEGRVDEARQLLAEALAIHTRVPEKHVSHVATLLELANLELQTGDAAQAEAHARAALVLAEHFRGGTQHSSWVGLSQAALGDIAAVRHEEAAAREWFRQAVDQIQPTLGDAHPVLVAIKKKLGDAPRSSAS
ncbi:MAG TPA: tetratricopeptide repeat protein [Usitatibacter sp.]|nr:tetratricopeptide repeat protein [Usitatibacter sp.]